MGGDSGSDQRREEPWNRRGTDVRRERVKIKVMHHLHLVEKCEDIKEGFNITKLRIRARWWSLLEDF